MRKSGTRHFLQTAAVGIALAAAAGAHSGRTNFIPTVPDPTGMTIDGFEDDWGWYPVDFVVTPDQIISLSGDHVGDGPNPNPDDFSAAYLVAWSPVPDNALWIFARCNDDTLRAAEGEVKSNWWRDDHLQVGIDSDHSGGEITGVSADTYDNGYRLDVHPLFTPQSGLNVVGQDGFDWTQLDPFSYFDTVVLPSDSNHLAAHVEYSFEMRLDLWDNYDPAGARNSRPHVFEPERALHLALTVWDTDGNDITRRSSWAQGGNQPDHWFDAGLMSDHVPLLTADITDYQAYAALERAAVVEHRTWGAIKSLLRRRDVVGRSGER